MDKDKKRLLESVKNSLKKKWGAEVFVEPEGLIVESISTGSPMLDNLITGTGYPEGRWIELYGVESSGKTTTGVIMLSKAQQKHPDKLVAVIDMEHAFAPKYAEQFGLDLDPEKFIICQPGSGEEALEITRELAGTGLFSAILFDSIGALITQQQLDKGIDEETMGAVARLLSKSASQINIASSNTNTTIIWINQTRSKIVMMGNPETVSGGNTMKFFHSVRIKVTKVDTILHPKTKDPIGVEVRYQSIKNKVGIPYREVVTSIFFGKGFDEYRENIEVAIKKNVLYSSGAWTYLNKGKEDELRWNGKAACISWYRDAENQSAYQHLCELIRTSSEVIDIDQIEPVDENSDD